MRLPTLLSFLTLVITVLATEDSDVLVLTPANFDVTVKSKEVILVEFFAPWCGHCKALAPHYEEAATALKAKNISLAKVDCVDQAELCQEHGVQGYPTLKVFRDGKPTDYNGPRKADGIISYMIKQSLPAVADVTAANHEEFKQADKVVVVAYVSKTDDAPAPSFTATAEKHRDDYLFGLSTDPEAIEAAGVAPPAIVFYRKFDEPRIDFPAGKVASASVEDIEMFLKDNSIPLVDEVSGDNFQVYAQSGLPLAYLFVDPAEDFQHHIEYLRPIAKKNQGKINFVWIDATKFGDHAKALNLLEPKWPSFVIQDLAQQLKFPLSQEREVTDERVASWVDQFNAGKLEPQLKSQAVPESQDESVYNLVGSEFEEVIFDENKDVFVEFYAPWCGHCKRLKPTWDSLGDRYSEVKERITIAKMDATENDIPPSAPFRISGFPTLKFKPAGTREFVDYNGDRSLESLIEFVEQQAKNPLDPKTPFKGKASSTKVAATEPTDREHDEL